MALKRTTIELDEALAAEAMRATRATLRSTVEQGLQLVIAASQHDEERRSCLLDRHLANAAEGVDFDVLLSGEAWR